MKSTLMRVLLAASVLFLTACSITPPATETANGAARLSTTVSTPGVDGAVVTGAVFDVQEIDPKTGKNSGLWKRTAHLFQGSTTLGETIKGVTGGMGAAWIQGEALKDATKLGKCADGANCGSVINVQSSSGSASQAVNQTNSNVGVNTGAPCRDLACTGK